MVVNEPNWECLGHDNLTTVVHRPATHEKCEQLKACKNWSAIKNSTEFNSIVASFRLICDDADKPEKIQIIQAASLVSF
jgi:hypothetical protein